MANFLKGFLLGFGLLVFFILGLVSTKIYEKFINKDELSIVKVVDISNDISYDSYVSYPIFSSSKKLKTKENLSENERENIIKAFGEILKIAKESKICEGGSYTIKPSIDYTNNQNYGYDFNSKLNCEFSKDKFQDYKTMLDNIYKALENNEFIVVNTPAINLSVSKKLSNEMKEKQYKDLYLKIQNMAKDYSNTTSKTCIIKSIQYYSNNHYPMLAKSFDAINDAPIGEKTTQNLSANVEFICK